MKTALITWREAARSLYDFLAENGRDEFHIRYVVENDNSLWGNAIAASERLSIISSGKAATLYSSGEVEKFLMPSLDEDTNEKIAKMLCFYGIAKEDVLYAPIGVLKDDALPMDRLRQICCYHDRRELETIEIHIADHCNLNCKNCSMFCGLVPHRTFPSFQQTASDIRKLKQFFDHVKVFRLIGGEPLLNPDLERYIWEARAAFPHTDIRMITNGILVRNMSPGLLQAIRECDVSFIVTHYLPVSDQMESIREFLAENQIRYTISGIITEFQKIYDMRGTADPAVRFASCHWKSSCATMGSGKIAACFVPFVIRYLSDTFQLDIKEDGQIDLYEEGLTTKEIRRRMQTPFSLCKYCAPKGMTAPWCIHRQSEGHNIGDWSVIA